MKTLVISLARRKTLACLLVALFPMAVRALLLPVYPVPEPRIHDEFSHLLLADTLAHGRVVNPVHPLWIHFDSMHTLVTPVYGSIYPPAHGAAMALGQKLGGHPWIGVWLSVGLMCGAICWALQGWVAPGWALLGGVLAAARFGVFSYWMNSYYGGAMAAVGGALLLGAAGRMVKHLHWSNAAALATGLAILANSRPYEGLAFSIPVLAYVAWRPRRSWRLGPVVAAAAILALTAAGMGYYFARFTGSPFTMPYQYFRSNYTEAPHFWWQAPRPKPAYRHWEIEHYYSYWEMISYRDARGGRPPRGVWDKAKSYSRFYIGPFLAVPLLFALPWTIRRRRTQFLLATGALLFAALALEVWNTAHYAAPALGLVALLVVDGLRQMRLGPGARWTVPAVCVASFLLPVIHGGTRAGDGRDRAEIIRKLEARRGDDLVVVRYTSAHDPGYEWVYNGADIDSSPVVWAREMDAPHNEKLLAYFHSRRPWLLEADATPPRLQPYPKAAASRQ